MIGTLLDIYTTTENEESKINLVFKDKENKLIHLIDNNFKPYFYILLENKEDIKKLEQVKEKYNIIEIQDAEYKKNTFQILRFTHHKLDATKIKEGKYFIKKILFKNIKNLIETRQKIKEEAFFKGKIEFDVPYDLRYMIDKQIKPLYKYEINNFNYKEIGPDFEYNLLALDIETLSFEKINPKKEPIVLVSTYGKNRALQKVITYKKPAKKEDYVIVVKNEKELLQELIKIIKENNIHFITTYNGDGFDLPYLRERAKANNMLDEFEKILNYKPHKNQNNTTCYTKGIQHIDAYKIIQYLNRIGAINLLHLKLDDVYAYLFNKHKIDLPYKDMREYYEDAKKLSKFIEYNLIDSKAVFEITNYFLMQYIKLAQKVGKTLQETIRASTSVLVETLLMFETIKENKIIPGMPKGEAVAMREKQSYEGGYVKEPKIGLHENIAVLDFRSFHPSIIITFNISPESLNIKDCNKNVKSPAGDLFCQDKKATIPKVLEEIYNERIKVKQKMKENSGEEYKKLYAQQWSLKILLNSIYGYLAYPRARWYCFECARSILKFTHKYIFEVIEEAKKYGLETIYSDTDSAFVLYKEKKQVFDFLEYINKKLPGVLYLSLENFYKRGIFVSKKQSERSAKKRYALIDEKNNLKITGFEYVRKDWSKIAKDMQKEVLYTILSTGDVEKAAKIVKDTIKKIKERKINLEDLAIITKIRKPILEYDSIGPHIAAALKAMKEGFNLNVGDNIEYIITKNGKTISDKAKIIQLTNKDDYDIEYYINNQIIPAVKSIFDVFGYEESKLKSEPTQRKLF